MGAGMRTLLAVWPHNSEMRKMGRKGRNLLTANLLPHMNPKSHTAVESV